MSTQDIINTKLQKVSIPDNRNMEVSKKLNFGYSQRTQSRE